MVRSLVPLERFDIPYPHQKKPDFSSWFRRSVDNELFYLLVTWKGQKIWCLKLFLPIAPNFKALNAANVSASQVILQVQPAEKLKHPISFYCHGSTSDSSRAKINTNVYWKQEIYPHKRDCSPPPVSIGGGREEGEKVIIVKKGNGHWYIIAFTFFWICLLDSSITSW